MRRHILVSGLMLAALVAAGLLAAAFTLRTYGPSAAWNVFAAPTQTPTATLTPTSTATNTSTPTPSSTATPMALPTETPEPAVAQPDPPEIPGPDVQGERWIDVDLDAQTTTAMIGDKPLYTALATTGKDGWETPKGTFHILTRVPDETMTSVSIGAEEYYILDHVLYTQYFTDRGHALHLNYWRSDDYFGHIRSSHGCVGLRLADAEFFWNFASLGTRVTIH
jgi:lipoprotein-anchoring transpeptidase ErfK/SrfK